MKQIQFTSGCPNKCKYCYEPAEIKIFSLKDNLDLIENETEVQILDMNFLANPHALNILRSLPKKKYEFVCGIDYRRLTQEIANLMKEKGFIKVQWAWDYNYGQQRLHKRNWEIFTKAGYKSNSLSVFILANWKIPFADCMKKLDLLKVWNVKVNDCCWDGGYKRAKAVYWTYEQMKKFRGACRKHNQLVNFKIDPEFH